MAARGARATAGNAGHRLLEFRGQRAVLIAAVPVFVTQFCLMPLSLNNGGSGHREARPAVISWFIVGIQNPRTLKVRSNDASREFPPRETDCMAGLRGFELGNVSLS